MISVVCKYTPIELFAGFGQTCTVLDHMSDNFDLSDSVAHINLCGFGKTVIQTALMGNADQLVLVNCCDVMRRSFEIVNNEGCCSFTFLMDLPHLDGPCQIDRLARSLKRLKNAYAKATGLSFNLKACQQAFSSPADVGEPYIGVLGVRAGYEMQQMIESLFSLPVRNLTCTGNRKLFMDAEVLATDDEDAFFTAYARALLSQIPCMRMDNPQGRRQLFEDPNLRGIIYHSMKFCDFYAPEYAQVVQQTTVPVLKIESDFTLQSKEQLRTRIEAFAETLQSTRKDDDMNRTAAKPARSGSYVAGIDSGSTSTDVVILNPDGTIRASSIIPTGGGAQQSAEASLKIALDEAGISEDEIANIVTTGYGRAYLDTGDDSITEITCHAKGAHYLNPDVRTIIDIGGQDSKVIRIEADGNVENFVMNDKCAAGTGRFLEMMARALQTSLEDMGTMGLEWHEDITISSMCSVFAESEVITLVAQNKAVPDIIHGLNNSVAAKVNTLVRRVGGQDLIMMTGGVAQNAGVVAAIEEKIGARLYISDKAQLCGALGAALFALER